MTREEELEMKLTQKIPVISSTMHHAKIFFVIILTVGLSGSIAFLTARQIIKDVVRQCGSKDRIVRSKEELLVALKTAHNNLFSGPIERFPADNLIDGNLETYAYPNDRIVDYTADLVDLYPLNEITIVWNEFGEQENYITKWYLEGCTKSGEWDILARGDAPKSKVTVVKIKDVVSQLRLRASAQKDWIGVYEMKID